MEKFEKEVNELNEDNEFVEFLTAEQEEEYLINTLRDEGREEGYKEKTIEIAKNLLKNKVDIDIIIDSTGLTREKIESLK